MEYMAKFTFPDPNDRSKNDPAIIVSSERVLGLYNQYNDDGDEMQKVTAKVQEWFVNEAKNNQGWDSAEFVANQCILKNEFKK